MRLVALDEQAEAAGLRRGLGVAEARAMLPGLDVIEAEPQADRSFLEGIASWADRYTPLVSIDGQDALFLDITGCAHLFGGEKALLDDILARLFHLGMDARGAITASPGLSWALCHHDQGRIVAADGAREALIPLPISALRLERPVTEALIKAGLRQIGDLLDAPRAPLARRFGPSLLMRLDQALGLDDEPISPRRPVAALSVERRLIEPIVSEDDILALTGQLAESLRDSLERRGEGGKMFELRLFRVDGKVVQIAVGTSGPLRDPKRIAALFAARLAGLQDELDAGFGFETVRISVLQSEAVKSVQTDFSGEQAEDSSLGAFIDQMTARFGTGLLSTPRQHESHMPERGSRLEPLSRQPDRPLAGRSDAPVPASLSQPIRLFRHPEPVEAVAEVPEGPPVTFRWRRAMHRVARAAGPERIAGEWWIDGETAPTRDYFRIEDEDGRRYWLYREGLYERETSRPRWFMHGVFA
jgi:protein ImuB